ncbi:hypothetical protein NR798_35540 [Archangium gephyra]|uniref:dCTP deaminase domain-containing protein n=1 Tax=Archangium gephyra TaxID=48 RepID=UPI0035D4944A
MSVIPFILDGLTPTVVCTEDDFNKHGHRNGEAILIEGIDKNQISIFKPKGLKSEDSESEDSESEDVKAKELKAKNAQEANTSYDLTVGDQYLNLSDNSLSGIDDKHPIHLKPGEAVIIRTAEFVHFPVTRFGNILPKVTMLHQGLSNTSSKVDPGYKGHLSITVFNLGKRTVEITHKQPFCTLYVLDVHNAKEDAKPYSKISKGLPAFPPKEDLKTRVLSFLSKYNWVITLAIATAALIVSFFKD